MLAENGVESEIIGRQLELAEIEAFIGRAAAGAAERFVVVGDAGIGKSTLWWAGVALARTSGVRVLLSQPAEAERSLSFAALGDLVGDVVPELGGELPAPRRRALEIALLIADARDERPDARAVSVAVLTLLQRLADDAPLLIAVDDYQWIDSPTRSALAFALRRLDDTPVGLLLSTREGSSAGDPVRESLPLERTREIVLAPLSLGAVGRVVHLRTGRPLARPVLRRVHELAGGNPYFALELARAAQRKELAFDRTAALPPALDRLVAGRIAALPEETQYLLAALAATSERTMDLVETLSSAGGDVLAPAVDADIVELHDGKIAFTHPLLASAAYARLSQPRQRELHGRMAKVVTGLEERVRHLGLVTEQPDAAIAQTLEDAAAEMRGRGASASAADLAEEALRLTPPGDGRRRHRMLVAADDLLEAGDSELAQARLEGAVEASAPGDERADALTRLAWVRAQRDSVLAAADLQRAALAEAHDPAVRTSIERGLAWATHVAGNLAQAGEHAQRAVELAGVARDRSALPLALADDMFIRFLRGLGFDRDVMKSALELESSAGPLPIIGRPSWLSGMVLTYVGELGEARHVLSVLRDDAVAQGDERAVPYVLNWLARVECYAGNWPAAVEYAEETYQSALETGQDVERAYAASTRALLAARLGATETARSAAAEALELADRIRLVSAAFEAKAALASLELSLAQPAAAYEHVRRLHAEATAAGFDEPSVFRFHPDAIDAAIAVGRVDEAEELVAHLVAHQETSQWTATVAARGRALVAAARGDIDLARKELARTLELHELFTEPFEHARTLLTLGTVERRAQAKRRARDVLTDAAAVFERLGAEIWLERARAELARIGGRRTAGSDLTPSERRVVELVVEGRTNREVASALFVSERTVEGHLSRIYGKLGVRSRTELARRVPAE